MKKLADLNNCSKNLKMSIKKLSHKKLKKEMVGFFLIECASHVMHLHFYNFLLFPMTISCERCLTFLILLFCSFFENENGILLLFWMVTKHEYWFWSLFRSGKHFRRLMVSKLILHWCSGNSILHWFSD